MKQQLVKFAFWLLAKFATKEQIQTNFFKSFEERLNEEGGILAQVTAFEELYRAFSTYEHHNSGTHPGSIRDRSIRLVENNHRLSEIVQIFVERKLIKATNQRTGDEYGEFIQELRKIHESTNKLKINKEIQVLLMSDPKLALSADDIEYLTAILANTKIVKYL